ncbi:hypothetical protein [Rhodoligotrophos ferricapiens]|uniref:hypothetical protein n=1 Tax=Rhodoligotrophos ferricapiens TaxID=3069264 RepID=UPI00315CBB85
MSGHTAERVKQASKLFEHMQKARGAGKDWWVDTLERVIVREVERDKLIAELREALKEARDRIALSIGDYDEILGRIEAAITKATARTGEG